MPDHDDFWRVQGLVDAWTQHTKMCSRSRYTRSVYAYFTPGMDRLLYVGKAAYPKDREKQHRKKSPWCSADCVVVNWPMCCDSHGRGLEGFLIFMLKPENNIAGKRVSAWYYQEYIAWYPSMIRESARLIGVEAPL